MLPVVLGLAGETLTPDERAFFREAAPAGFILFSRNLRTPSQARALTDALRDLTGRADLPILVDQEGGPVARLQPPEWPAFPPARRFGELYARAPISAIEAVRVNAQAIGLVLSEAGITVNCAPVLDLAHTFGHPVIGARAFGDDPTLVASLGRAMLDGLAAAGIVGVIKHIPGHGRALQDSHDEAPLITAAAEDLESDLLPFTRLRTAPAAMAAHVRFAAWDSDRPATISRTVITEVIRGRIGFEGLLISDDLKMNALTGAPGQRAVAVLAAGCDLALHGSGKRADGEAIAAAVPEITAAARARLLAAMASAGAPQGEFAALIAKRDALLCILGTPPELDA